MNSFVRYKLKDRDCPFTFAISDYIVERDPDFDYSFADIPEASDLLGVASFNGHFEEIDKWLDEHCPDASLFGFCITLVDSVRDMRDLVNLYLTLDPNLEMVIIGYPYGSVVNLSICNWTEHEIIEAFSDEFKVLPNVYDNRLVLIKKHSQ